MMEDFSLDKEFDEEIDLTPLIDVVFILLIFFFITSTFIRPSLPVDLARAASSAVAERKEQLVITIDAEGGVFHEDTPLSRDRIAPLLRAHPELGINLFVDRAAPFEAFLDVVDEARLLNREDLSITTLPDPRE